MNHQNSSTFMPLVRNTGKESDIKFPGTIMRLTKQNWFIEEWSASGDGQCLNMITCNISGPNYQLKIGSTRSQSELFCIANTLLNRGKSNSLPAYSSHSTFSEVGAVVKNMVPKHCELDPLPIWLIKYCAYAKFYRDL